MGGWMGGDTYHVRVAICVEKFGVQGVACSVQVAVEVVPALRVDGERLLAPGRSAVCPQMPGQSCTYTVVNLANGGLLAVHEAQEAHHRRCHLSRCQYKGQCIQLANQNQSDLLSAPIQMQERWQDCK
eukprot:6180919-Pleurochrysis_carterae.AAC.2